MPPIAYTSDSEIAPLAALAPLGRVYHSETFITNRRLCSCAAATTRFHERPCEEKKRNKKTRVRIVVCPSEHGYLPRPHELCMNFTCLELKIDLKGIKGPWLVGPMAVARLSVPWCPIANFFYGVLTLCTSRNFRLLVLPA